MEDSGFSPIKIAILGIILAVFVGIGYMLTRSNGPSDEATATAATAAPANADATAGATPAAPDSTAAAPAPAADASTQSTAAAAPDQASTSPAPAAETQTAAAEPSPASTVPAAASAPPAPSEAPAPASEAAMDTTPAPAPEEAAAKPTPSHHHHSSTTAESNSSSHKEAYAPPSALAVLTPWWRAAAGSFNIVAVGPASGKQGVVVVFSADLKDPVAAGQSLTLSRSGQAVPGQWQVGANNHVLVRTDLPSGSYVLTVPGSITSTSSQNLGINRSGPVFVPPGTN